MSRLSFNSKEYFKLIQQLLDQQYHDEETSSEDINDSAWIPSEPEAKQKLLLKEGSNLDLTTTKKDKIKDLIIDHKKSSYTSSIKVGDFLIKINTFDQAQIEKFNVCIYEEKHRTQTGQPCKMLYKVDVLKDARFSQCSWTSDFTTWKNGKITVDVMIDIVRWLQAIRKLTAFI